MRHRGFTALELMIAMLLIVVVAALLMPIFALSRENARRIMCLSNLHQIGQGLQMYAQDNAGHFPPKTNDMVTVWPYAERGVDPYWYPSLYRCPSDRSKPKGWDEGAFKGKDNQWYRKFYTSYCYNGGYSNDDAPGTPLLAEAKSWHVGLINVYYLGLGTKSVKMAEWKPFAPRPKVLVVPSPEDTPEPQQKQMPGTPPAAPAPSG